MQDVGLVLWSGKCVQYKLEGLVGSDLQSADLFVLGSLRFGFLRWFWLSRGLSACPEK